MPAHRNVFNHSNGNTPVVATQQFSLGDVAFFIGPSIDEGDSRTNQDSLAILELSDQSLVFVVADGAGGHRSGAEASKTAIEALIASLPKDRPENGWKGALLHAIDNANEAVIALGVGAATTFLLTHINAKGVRTFHVGDSGALVVGQKGKVKLQTLSHSPVSYAVESGMLDEESALTHESRNIVSNLLGIEDTHTQISGRAPLSKNDSLILASDGLLDNLRQEEIIDMMRKGDIAQTLEQLVKLTHARMLNPQDSHPSKLDDLSVILFRPNTQSI